MLAPTKTMNARLVAQLKEQLEVEKARSAKLRGSAGSIDISTEVEGGIEQSVLVSFHGKTIRLSLLLVFALHAQIIRMFHLFHCIQRKRMPCNRYFRGKAGQAQSFGKPR